MSAATAAKASVDTSREDFDSRKSTNISRKVTACVACRKQKIKCHMKESQPPCARCKKRNLPCAVNRGHQMLEEEDTSWRHSVKRRMGGFEEAIDLIADKLSMPELKKVMKEREGDVSGSTRRNTSRQQMDLASASSNHALPAWEVVMDPESGPAAVPASCVSTIPHVEKPSLLPTGDRSDLDLITRGVVSLETAEYFFSFYNQKLDHFLYGILTGHDSLSSVRASSPLLTAAVCAVGALHASSTEFDACYEELISLSTAQVFSRKNTPDDVRALCIGAFWLNDASWTLIGLAVRIATEIELHRCISKMPHEKRECYLRTRLWYLVYVCDHHCSIAYGKPPMSHEFEALNPTTSFLDSKYATKDDARLVSQVELWSISTRVFQSFGVDTAAPLSDRLVPQLRRFGIALDTWRANWNERDMIDGHVRKYPHNDIGLHFHFAKLYLCSHAFRGLHQTSDKRSDLSSEFEEIASTAVLSAISILRIVVSDAEIQSQLNGLPLYFDTMIAFAVVFLLKIVTKEFQNVRIDRQESLSLVGQLDGVLKSLKSSFHQRHLLFSIATSIEKLLERCLQSPNKDMLPRPSAHAHPGSETVEGVQGWTMSPSETCFLNNYDFVGSQDLLNGFDFDLGTLDFDPMQQ